MFFLFLWNVEELKIISNHDFPEKPAQNRQKKKQRKNTPSSVAMGAFTWRVGVGPNLPTAEPKPYYRSRKERRRAVMSVVAQKKVAKLWKRKTCPSLCSSSSGPSKGDMTRKRVLFFPRSL